MAPSYHLALGKRSAIKPGIGPEPSRRAARRSGSTPSLFEARSLLVQCLLRSREPDKADAEFQALAPILSGQPRGLGADGTSNRNSLDEVERTQPRPVSLELRIMRHYRTRHLVHTLRLDPSVLVPVLYSVPSVTI